MNGKHGGFQASDDRNLARVVSDARGVDTPGGALDLFALRA